MPKLSKLKDLLISQGFVNVDAIISSCASAMLTEKARESAAAIMDSWSVEELKAATFLDNSKKPVETAAHHTKSRFK